MMRRRERQANIKADLFYDCKTDIERADFFASGRAHETGIVSESIENEVARAFFARNALRMLREWIRETDWQQFITEYPETAKEIDYLWKN
jgi:hypothetical protein